ncbi:MAG: hypothetical protein ABIN45_05575, partial [Gammaproteobacteria bacterium]
LEGGSKVFVQPSFNSKAQLKSGIEEALYGFVAFETRKVLLSPSQERPSTGTKAEERVGVLTCCSQGLTPALRRAQAVG